MPWLFNFLSFFSGGDDVTLLLLVVVVVVWGGMRQCDVRCLHILWGDTQLTLMWVTTLICKEPWSIQDRCCTEERTATISSMHTLYIVTTGAARHCWARFRYRVLNLRQVRGINCFRRASMPRRPQCTAKAHRETLALQREYTSANASNFTHHFDGCSRNCFVAQLRKY